LWCFTPPHFASPGLCYAKPLSGLAKRRIQPTRYVQFFTYRFWVVMKINAVILYWNDFFEK
jgi:hypothetical protein